MTISEADFERLSQLLDGELDTAARRQLEQRIALEPELASIWNELQSIHAELRQAYVGIEASGVPGNITALLNSRAQQGGATDNVVPFFRRKSFGPMALAASVVLAVAIALIPDNARFPASTPGLTLAAVLEALPSGNTWQALDDGSEVQAVLTFPSRDGDWCREFAMKLTAAGGTRRGVACRKEGQWRTEVIAQAPGPESTDVYRPAGAGDSSTVQHFIRNQAADIPLDGRQESTLIRNGWR